MRDDLKVGAEIVTNALGGAGQRDAADQQAQQHRVGEQRREPDHLARRADTLPQGEVADQVDGQQTQRQVPLHNAQVVDAVALVQLQNCAAGGFQNVHIHITAHSTHST